MVKIKQCKDKMANLQGEYDVRSSLSENVKLGNPLLSRFDIVLVLRDMRIPSWDEAVADHLLGLDTETRRGPSDLVIVALFLRKFCTLLCSNVMLI